MKKRRDLLFAIFVMILNSSILAAIFLINSSNWPFFEELWGKIPWVIILFMLALIAATGLTIWASWRVIGGIDKAKDEQQITVMKEAFKQALKEVGLAKEVSSKQKSENKLNNQTGTKK